MSLFSFLDATERAFVYNIVVRESKEGKSKSVELVKKESQQYSAPSYHLADAYGGTGSALQQMTPEILSLHSKSHNGLSFHLGDAIGGTESASPNELSEKPLSDSQQQIEKPEEP
jgi:hypothetical protein